MDSTIPEGASQNPYQEFVEDYASINKNYDPVNYRGHGRYTWIQVAEDTKRQVEEQINKIQTTLLWTMKKLSNERNISQLQERVYLKLKRYEDEFNVCHVQARTPSQASVCSEVLLERLKVNMPKHISSILQEY